MKLKSKEALEDKLNHLIENNQPIYENNHLSVKNPKKKVFWVLAVFALIVLAFFLQYEVRMLQIKHKRIERTMLAMRNGMVDATTHLGNRAMPFRFANVPYADDQGIILSVKPLSIRNVFAPYNPSLVKTPSGYDVFFRYDILSSRANHAPFLSHIGVASFNERFEQLDTEFKKVKVPTDYAEDPRTIVVDDQLLLFYNALNIDNLKCRSMCVAHLDDHYDVTDNCFLDMNLQWVEKNWAPFVYNDEEKNTHLLVQYQLMPRKLLDISFRQSNMIQNVTLPRDVSYFEPFWSANWGEMRGGTPAVKIGDDYLGFFHSSFKCNGIFWYVMGAYTFEAAPPFRLTSISNHPILFRGIYELSYQNTADRNKSVIFPTGLVVEEHPDGDLIHLACGENDSGIKIITMNKEKLLNSLRKFEL